MAIEKFEGEYAFLSNFFHFPCEYEGVTYRSVEHAFQAAKSLDLQERKRIAALPHPGMAKRAGRKITLRPDWEEVKTVVMYDCVKSKFSHPELKKMLLATGEEELIEGNVWHDNFWGNCTCPDCAENMGNNELGKILMKIRAEFTTEETNNS